MGPMGCPEKSIRHYHYPLRNNPGKSSSHLLSRGSLKSSIVHLYGVATLHYIQRDSKDVLTRKPSNFPCYTRSKCGSDPSIIKGTSLEEKNVVPVSHVFIRGVFPTIHTSDTPRTYCVLRHFRCDSSLKKKIHLVKKVLCQLYLCSYARDFTDTPELPPCGNGLQSMHVFMR